VPSRVIAALLTVAAVVGVSVAACGTSTGQGAGECLPVRGPTTATVLADDKGAIPANNVVPVVSSGSTDFRTVLSLVAKVSRALSAADVERVVTASPLTLLTAIRAAIADVEGMPRRSRLRTLTVGIPRERSSAAVAILYAAGLRRAGITVRSRPVADAPSAMGDLAASRVAIVPVPLGQLSHAVGAPNGGTTLQQRLRAVSSAGAHRRVAIGTPTQVSDRTVLAIAGPTASSLSVRTIDGLARRCHGRGLVIGATAQVTEAAEALARTYGLQITTFGGSSALSALSDGRATAVLIPAAELQRTPR
jgi:glycine betaine/choline ABC-type transport system substrate-binding protein